MTQKKTRRIKARLPRGFVDKTAKHIALEYHLVSQLADVYEAHGFSLLATPALEYSDALGKFLPDAERPNAGVFSLQDDDGQWLSLRYDLTGALARYVAQNYDQLPKPFRRYSYGTVWRNEKPGLGRFREFLQLDADIVDTPNLLADAELCQMASEAMQALQATDYSIRINHRSLLDGILAGIGLQEAAANYAQQRLTILRAMDKLERLGPDAVAQLLQKGRKDASGDFTKGAGLDVEAAKHILDFLTQAQSTNRADVLAQLRRMPYSNTPWQTGLDELDKLDGFLADDPHLIFDMSIVRGLDYYTGIVFEICWETKNHGVGAVGGGGRYDGLIARFRNAPVPATGMSLGISRLAGLLADTKTPTKPPPILIAQLGDPSHYARLAQDLRSHGLACEVYTGQGGLKSQLRYADKRGLRFVVLEGEYERAKDQVTIKDMQQGKAASADITDNTVWRSGNHAQEAVPKAQLVETLKRLIRIS